MIVQVPAAAPLPRRLRAVGAARHVAPGLALAAAGAAAGFLVHVLVPGVPVVMVALALGLVVANAGRTPVAVRPGLALASGTLLRVGIVVLGFELVLQDMLTLGARGLLVVVAVVVATFFGTRWAGKRLGVSDGLSLLVATGFSICGVSAIAAAREVTEVDEEEVTYAIALVTLCGSLAIVLLPALNGIVGLDDRDYGMWAGASVHDIAQVVATSSAVGGVAVATAVVVKLARVLLLGPLVAWIAWRQGRSAGVSRLRLVPPFVLAFVAAAALRSADLVPSGLLPVLADTKTVLLAVALFAVGARVELRRLLAVGGRPLALGISSWAIVAVVAFAGVTLVSA
ncbi:MAG: YeiH family protein [Gaiellaceae bacterium]